MSQLDPQAMIDGEESRMRAIVDAIGRKCAESAEGSDVQAVHVKLNVEVDLGGGRRYTGDQQYTYEPPTEAATG